MKKVKLMLAALMLCMSTVFLTPATAQTGGGTTTATGTDDAEDDNDGDEGKWGLLGLAGLL